MAKFFQKEKYQKWDFELEFQLRANGKYEAHALIGSKVSKTDWAKLYLGQFDTVQDVKKGFQDFKNEFTSLYESVGQEMILRGAFLRG